MEKFSGKVAIVTGGVNGIGLKTVELLVKNGAKVAIIGNKALDGIELTNILIESGSNVIFIETDLRNQASVTNAVDIAVQNFGGIDILVNAAMIILEPKLTAEYTEHDWDKIMDINVKGTWFTMTAVLKEMLKNNYGKIVNLSSYGGIRGMKGFSSYSASQHAVVGLTKSAALEYAEKNININCICPWIIKNSFVEEMFIDDLKEIVKQNPMNRIAYPEEVANTILYLCSEEASFITGQNINIDGGQSAK
ncbi:MAG: SDR family oxidoreductase [Fusobacteria bacterium]|nr:SDR family oxidoreductase [Fusobacteriota bacterium]